jgi:hypothetical protein
MPSVFLEPSDVHDKLDSIMGGETKIRPHSELLRTKVSLRSPESVTDVLARERQIGKWNLPWICLAFHQIQILEKLHTLRF